MSENRKMKIISFDELDNFVKVKLSLDFWYNKSDLLYLIQKMKNKGFELEKEMFPRIEAEILEILDEMYTHFVFNSKNC
jgi:oligoribonuclease NrnB/cAMP/cGMP phosphodiesterase (DHH superfamily)